RARRDLAISPTSATSPTASFATTRWPAGNSCCSRWPDPPPNMTPLAEVTQLVVNGAMAGTILAVPAIGLTAIYAVLRFPNFAIASHATVGAFAGYVANVTLSFTILPSLAIAFTVAGVVGVVSDELVLKRFRPAGYI